MTKFILNNEIITTDAHSGITLLDFIREHKQLKGTKIGCREGDCGACTVLVGSLKDKTVSYKSITSCISPLGNANGKHIVTVEGINLNKKLNTVQQAMNDNNGTQCGFCTPGFVVSMTGHALNTKDKTLGTCNDAISGNICRCTGYKSIEKAGDSIDQKLKDKSNSHDLKWLIENEFIPSYFDTIANRLANLEVDKISSKGRVVANGTDLYVHGADALAEADVNLISSADALLNISKSNNRITIEANATVSDIVDHEMLMNQIPRLKDFLKLVSSEPIRNMGTIGGNFVNASPIGDMTIFFLALNSSLNLFSNKGDRQIPFSEFHQDYKKYDLKEGELVKSVEFSEINENEYFNFEKVSKRTHLDIATVNSAIRISMNGKLISSAHVSMGGVAAVPKYLTKTGSFLAGKILSEDLILETIEALQTEISPISDVRGSSDYKRLLARQLFLAHFIRLFPDTVSPKILVAS